MYVWRGFVPEENKIIEEALSFAKSRIKKYWLQKRSLVDTTHHDVIDKEITKLVYSIESVEAVIKDDARSIGPMRAEDYGFIMNTIKSALGIYLQDTLNAKAESGLDAFDRKIERVRQIIDSEFLKDWKNDLFNKYSDIATASLKSEEIEIFFSYSHKDRLLAGKIASLLIEKGISVFLAHEHIEVSKEWRDEIFEHLKTANVLLALLTPNYKKSVWANQEAGYMFGKKACMPAKIISLIVEETQIEKFGFLEAFQGFNLRKKILLIV